MVECLSGKYKVVCGVRLHSDERKLKPRAWLHMGTGRNGQVAFCLANLHV